MRIGGELKFLRLEPLGRPFAIRIPEVEVRDFKSGVGGLQVASESK